MQVLSVKDGEIMQVALQQEILRSEESRYDHKLHGVLLAAQGYDSYQIGEMFGQSPTTIQRWVNRFNKSGFAGLQDKERPGRPRSLDAKQWSKIEKHLRQPPQSFGYKQNLWDGRLLAKHLQEHLGVVLGIRQCQRLFKAMGFRYRKPRPVIAKAEEVDQSTFKKTPVAGKKNKA